MKHYAGFLIRRERLRQNLSQEGLCRGICAVSYLSKIEQGLVTPSREILDALFRALGLRYVNDKALLDRARRELRGYFERFFLNVLKEEEDAWLSGQEEALSSSPLALAYRLYRLYRAAWTDDQTAMRPEIDALTPFLDYLDESQLFLFYMARGLLREDEAAREDAFVRAQRLHPCAFAKYHHANFDFLRGRYVQAAQGAEQAYAAACEEGNGLFLLYASALTGMCYANQYHYPLMMRAFRRALALAQSLQPDFAGQIHYNIGASCLELRRYEEALQELEAALQYPFDADDAALLVHHKLAIAHEKLGHLSKARLHLDQAFSLYTPTMPGIYLRMLRVVQMRLSADYFSDPAYTALLREIYDESEAALHFGFKQFHGRDLIEAYAHQRRYKEALAISQDISDFSCDPPFNAN